MLRACIIPSRKWCWWEHSILPGFPAACWDVECLCSTSTTFSGLAPKSNTQIKHYRVQPTKINQCYFMIFAIKETYFSLQGKPMPFPPHLFLWGNYPSETKDTHCIIISAVETSNMLLSFPRFTAGPGMLGFFAYSSTLCSPIFFFQNTLRFLTGTTVNYCNAS